MTQMRISEIFLPLSELNSWMVDFKNLRQKREQFLLSAGTPEDLFFLRDVLSGAPLNEHLKWSSLHDKFWSFPHNSVDPHVLYRKTCGDYSQCLFNSKGSDRVLESDDDWRHFLQLDANCQKLYV